MLIIRGLEVSQAIQHYRADQHLSDPADQGPDNSLRLVAQKPAWVRVYVESDAPGDIAGVTGTLQVDYGALNARAGQAGLTLSPQAPGTVTAPFQPDYATTRSSLTMTLNFVVPAGRMYGPLVLKANVSDGNEPVQSSITVAATLAQTLRLRGIMIGYDGRDPASPDNRLTIPAPGLAELQATAGWAMRVMPVRSTGVFQVASTLMRGAPLTGTASNGGCTADWLALNVDVAAAKAADGNLPGFFYYGLLADDFPNSSNNGGCASSGVSSGFAGDGLTLAHEIGHMCGRRHAPCGAVGFSGDFQYPAYEPYDAPMSRRAGIGEYGLDVVNGRVPDPSSARDYMSYCGPKWISIYGHEALIDHEALNPEYLGVRRPWWRHWRNDNRRWWQQYQPRPSPYWIDPQIIKEFPPPMQKVVTVIGVLHPDQAVEVHSVTRSEVVSTELLGDATELRVALLGARGAELASAPAVAMAAHGQGCECGGNDADKSRPRLFQAFVPDAGPGTALVILRGDKPLWKRAAPKAKLSVSAVKVKAVEGEAIQLSWSATVPAAWVRVSADEGRTWRSLATGLTERKALIAKAHIPAGKVLFEVVVHDGFNSLRSKPVPFDIPELPPVPAILHPLPGQALDEGETLCLWGSVAGQPGASDGRYTYAWKLDGKEVGDELQVYTQAPKAGRHQGEFVVRDTDGKTVRSASVEFVGVRD